MTLGFDRRSFHLRLRQFEFKQQYNKATLLDILDTGGWLWDFCIGCILQRFHLATFCGNGFEVMAEDDKGTSSWYKVPVWDGSPGTWRAFRREMNWWTQSLNLEESRKYNLAARWLLHQSGTVKARGEEFDPADLQYQKEIKAIDPHY